MARQDRGPFPSWLQPLDDLAADAKLFARTTGNAPVWRFTVVVPHKQIKPTKKPKATKSQLNDLRIAFVRHFGGVTSFPDIPGYGLRDPDKPSQAPEHNINRSFVVYSASIDQADHYFRTLQELLRKRLEEGVILIEKQEVLLL